MSIISFLLRNSLYIVTIPHVVKMYHVVVHVKIRKESFLEVSFAMSIVFLSCQLVFPSVKLLLMIVRFLLFCSFERFALIPHNPCMKSIQTYVSVLLNSKTRFPFFRQCRTKFRRTFLKRGSYFTN
jgi:hypothetical protein